MSEKEKMEKRIKEISRDIESYKEAIENADAEAGDAAKEAVAEAEKASGCGSFAGGAWIVVASVLGAAWCAGRKE